MSETGVTSGMVLLDNEMYSSRLFFARYITRHVMNHSEPMTRPLVLCGPSGSGKSTLFKRLMADFGDYLGLSVSHTTRNPRPGEENGRDYHFTTREEMDQSIDNGDFIESAEFSGNKYGTSKKAVRDVLEKGRICVLDIDCQGVKQIKETELNPLYVFIKPPSLDILEKRLRERATESEEALQMRLNVARDEITYGETDGNFDIIIVNDDLDNAYKALRDFLLPEIEMLKHKG